MSSIVDGNVAEEGVQHMTVPLAPDAQAGIARGAVQSAVVHCQGQHQVAVPLQGGLRGPVQDCTRLNMNNPGSACLEAGTTRRGGGQSHQVQQRNLLLVL